jgi:hypothetical protein
MSVSKVIKTNDSIEMPGKNKIINMLIIFLLFMIVFCGGIGFWVIHLTH